MDRRVTKSGFILPTLLEIKRRMLGWSQNDLAMRVGLSQPKISQLENSSIHGRVSRATLENIAAVLRWKGDPEALLEPAPLYLTEKIVPGESPREHLGLRDEEEAVGSSPE